MTIAQFATTFEPSRMPDLGLADRLMGPTPCRRLARGEALFHEGDPANYCYELVVGCVKTSKLTADGRSLILYFALPGDMIGLGNDRFHGFSAEAVNEAVVRPVAVSRVKAAFVDSPDLVSHLVALSFAELDAAREHLLLLGLKNPRERLASFLVGLARRQGAGDGDHRVRLELCMSRRDIAEHLGLTPETVCRVFAQFRREGLIETPSCAEVEIRDWALLIDHAEGLMAEEEAL